MNRGRPSEKSFKQWCNENGRNDIIERWDYSLNDINPEELGYGTHKKAWLKCQNRKHVSSEHSIQNLIKNPSAKAECKYCNSCAQAIRDKCGNEYLENIVGMNPNINLWEIGKTSHKKIMYVCDTGKHKYEREVCAALQRKCIYCDHHAPKIKPARGDSLGDLYPQYAKLWSEKNAMSPYEVFPRSNKEAFWKCEEGVHSDYKRSVDRQIRFNLSCPECSRIRLSDKTRENLIGKKFGELTVKYLDSERTYSSKSTYWIVECSCGKVKSVTSSELKTGHTKTCGDKSIHRSGENNSNWKGGLTSELEKEMKSHKYKDFQKLVYSKDWYTCQCCGKSGGMVEKHVHHFFNKSVYKDYMYDMSKVITLCKSCHTSTYGSFHATYGTRNNTPEQLEEYINNKRKELGINIPFSVEGYLLGEVLKPETVPKTNMVA